MTTYIVLASALAVIQFWVIPFLINVKNLNWQMSNRDESLDDSVLLKRARRAGANILETLPIYLVFCLLSIIEAKDISEPAFYWLILRVIHGLCYLLGIAYVRTLAWLGSLGCLIVMGLSLICYQDPAGGTKKRASKLAL